MRLEITENIDESYWRYLTQWRERVFPEEGIGKEWTDVRWHISAFAEQQYPVAHLGFDIFTILIDGAEHKITGVGGVVVRPEYQGQGIPTRLFDNLHQQSFEKTGAEVYALFCPTRLVSYYAKHGYRRHEGAVWFLQRGKRTRSSFEFMYRGAMATRACITLQSPPW